MPREADWAARLLQAGYAVLLPESFAARGQGSQCGVRERSIQPWRERRADAAGAQAFLAAQPFIDVGRIALLGWSHGGATVMGSLDLPGYAAFVAFYPSCARSLRNRGPLPAVPTLVLLGAADDWTPAAPCQALAPLSARFRVVTYADAHHGFDAPAAPVRQRGGVAFGTRGDGTAHVGTNPEARADALSLVPEFLASAMRPKG
jgi:dienelactone hydrolase